MAVITIFAPPGGGKTTTAVRFARRALQRKSLSVGHFFWKVFFTDESRYDRVYSNFPIPGCYQLEKEDLGKYDFHYCLLIIDESAGWFNNRDYKNFSEQFFKFFREHRHQHCDIICVTQNYDDLDKKIRGYTRYLFYVKPLLFGLIKIIPVEQGEPDFDKHMQSRYFKAPPVSCSVFPQFIYRKYFDSYSCEPLPPNPAELWEEDAETKISFRMRVKAKLLFLFETVKLHFCPSDPVALAQAQKISKKIADEFDKSDAQ